MIKSIKVAFCLYWRFAVFSSMILLLLFPQQSCGDGMDLIFLPKKLPCVTPNWNQPEETLSGNCGKVVVYMKAGSISRNLRWKYYMDRNPDIPFLFFVMAKKRESVEKLLQLPNFGVTPNLYVFHDTDSTFAKANKIPTSMSSIAFLLNGKNEKIDVTNPSMPDFQTQLNKLPKCH